MNQNYNPSKNTDRFEETERTKRERNIIIMVYNKSTALNPTLTGLQAAEEQYTSEHLKILGINSKILIGLKD